MSETLAANTADGAGSWSSAWSSAGGWLSVMSLALGPLAGVAAAWVAGRERRRDAHELLSTSSRPMQQRLLMTWMANVVAVPAGLVIVAVVVATAVFPDAKSYTGGRWAVTWFLVLLGVITCSAIGFAAGRLLPVRLAGPLVGVVLYCWGALATLFGEWYLHLAPVGQLESEEGSRMSGQFILPLVVWLLALTVLALIVATTRNGRLSVIVVLIATAAVIGLKDERKDALDRIWFEPDPAAMAQVCTPDEPQVCVLGLHADLLPTVTPVAREAMRTAAKYYPITRAVEEDVFTVGVTSPPDALPLYLRGTPVPFRRTVIDLDGIRRSAGWLVDPMCPGAEAYHSGKAPQVAIGVAAWIVSGALPVEESDPAAVTALYRRVTATPQQQAAWMARYRSAATRCDIAALTRLARK